MEQPVVCFDPPLSETDAYYLPQRGYAGHVYAVIGDRRYPLYFIDQACLGQELKHNIKAGRRYFSEPGLIIVPEVTVETIESAVQSLWQDGYFDSLTPEGNPE